MTKLQNVLEKLSSDLTTLLAYTALRQTVWSFNADYSLQSFIRF